MPDESLTNATFRTNMRAARERHGWAQGELARRLGDAGWPTLAHQTTLTRIENGQRPVKLDEALAIADALETPLDRLLTAPEAVQDMEALTTMSRTLRDQHEAVERAIVGVDAARYAVRKLREALAQRIEAGEFEGRMDKYARSRLRHADQALAMSVDDAIKRGKRRQGHTFTTGRRAQEHEEGSDDATATA